MTTELLYYVLKSLTDRDSIKLSDINSKYDIFYFYQDKSCSIDAHRLMHLCKLFALDNGFKIQSGYTDIDEATATLRFSDRVEIFVSDTESKAVFEATQFIIDKLLKGE